MKESDAVKIALIVGSTRPNRFADVPARWIEQGSAERLDMTLETLDLRDWPLPFFNEPASPSATGGLWWARALGNARALAGERAETGIVASISE
jgi:NAD(P)H-dependent FMN reductase